MGFEPTTVCLQSRCSTRLSYTPVFGCWSSRQGLNLRPLRCERSALPSELRDVGRSQGVEPRLGPDGPFPCSDTARPAPGLLASSVVAAPGLEPGASSVSRMRSTYLSYATALCGAHARTRTWGLQLRKLALCPPELRARETGRDKAAVGAGSGRLRYRVRWLAAHWVSSPKRKPAFQERSHCSAFASASCSKPAW